MSETRCSRPLRKIVAEAAALDSRCMLKPIADSSEKAVVLLPNLHAARISTLRRGQMQTTMAHCQNRRHSRRVSAWRSKQSPNMKRLCPCGS